MADLAGPRCHDTVVSVRWACGVEGITKEQGGTWKRSEGFMSVGMSARNHWEDIGPESCWRLESRRRI